MDGQLYEYKGWSLTHEPDICVKDNGQEVARVRLISANGILLEDSVDDGIVLFLDDRYIRTPLQAELYNSQGMLVGTHQVL